MGSGRTERMDWRIDVGMSLGLGTLGSRLGEWRACGMAKGWGEEEVGRVESLDQGVGRAVGTG